jgi:hypothetical protein
MRRCMTRPLSAAAGAAAAAAVLVLAAAAAAASTAGVMSAAHVSPPSGGPPVYTAPCPSQTLLRSPVLDAPPGAPACSGYQASGRDFRFAQALITVPVTPCAIGSPMMYIALAGADSYARAGIQCRFAGGPARRAAGNAPADGPGSHYQAFFTVWHQGFAVFTRTISLDTVSPGDGVFFSIYFNQAGNADQFTASGPGVSAAVSAGAHGPVYDLAYALADWSLSLPATPAQPFLDTRVTQFLRGRFTTASGQRGTFEGPWNLNPVEVTSNGFAPPGGTLISAPSHLWTDGHSLSGLPGDAFGVWLYH